MNISSTTSNWHVGQAAGSSVSGKTAGSSTSTGSSAGSAETEFLELAKMSPTDRMRAGILKSMNLTEEQLASLPKDEQKKIEDEIKEKIKKMVGDNPQSGQLVDLAA